MRLMIVVAIVALALGVTDQIRMRNRAAEYRKLAALFASEADQLREWANKDVARRLHAPGDAVDDLNLMVLKTTRGLIQALEQSKRRYEYAAEHPREPLRKD
ncbi:hypothetical protein ACYOEI_08705 [Singulisphaera rosea]